MSKGDKLVNNPTENMSPLFLLSFAVFGCGLGAQMFLRSKSLYQLLRAVCVFEGPVLAFFRPWKFNNDVFRMMQSDCMISGVCSSVVDSSCAFGSSTGMGLKNIQRVYYINCCVS